MQPFTSRQLPTKHLQELQQQQTSAPVTTNEIILKELIQLKVNLAEVREQVEVNDMQSQRAIKMIGR